MKKEVRILLVGEPKVGKTSLVLSLVSEEFSTVVPPRAEEITIPADVTPERVPTLIVDYSYQDQTQSQLQLEIKKANVICVVYAVNDDDSIQKLTSCWLPFIRSSLDNPDERTPIVLVGNKSDLSHTSKLDVVLPIMNEYSEVETCIECSAKTMRNLSETFWFAQKAVLYPTGPLYLPDKKELTNGAIKALVRIFKICDMDNDGFLNDKELETFQRRCFRIPLNPQSLEDVKNLVRKNLPEGLSIQGLTLKGFLYLHQTFIQKGRHETTWAVLRRFGYDNRLELTKDYLHPKISVFEGCTTELSLQGLHFIQMLFDKYDADQDGCLSPTELASLFSTCPNNPWNSEVNSSVPTNPLGWITKEGFMAQWVFTIYLEVDKALEYLAYLGYTYEFDEGLSSAVTVTREKRLDLHKRQTHRTVFYCRVYGARNVGKTCFLQSFLGRNIHHLAALSRDRLPNFSVNCVLVYGQPRFLILHEIDAARGEQMSQDEALSADAACLIYDTTDADSFKYVADLYLTYYRGTRCPVQIVGSKAEKMEVCQNYSLDPSEFCNKYRLNSLQSFSCLDRLSDEIFIKLAAMANYPHLRGLQIAQGDYAWKFTLAATVLAGFGFVAFRIAKTGF